MNNLVIVSHPDKNSFCYNGIFKTIISEINNSNENLEVIDLYNEPFSDPKKELVIKYQNLIKWSNKIYFISPIWWFRLTPRMEMFFDLVFTPGFAFDFVNITKIYAYPRSYLKDKKIRTYMTHGAPALPVMTLYLNSIKLRLVMGVYSFVFGWKPSLWFNTKQFWSIPFINNKKRLKYLEVVKKDLKRDLKN